MNDQLTWLASQLAEKGPAHFHTELVRLASSAKRLAPGAAAVLADSRASDVVRLRAFSVVTRLLNGADTPNVDRVA